MSRTERWYLALLVIGFVIGTILSRWMVEALLIAKENGWPTSTINAVASWLAEYDGYVPNDSNVALRSSLAESILDALASVGGDSQ